MENSKKGDLYIHHIVKLSKTQCPGTSEEIDNMSRVSYAYSIGSIIFSKTYTHPDVSFAFSMVSQFQDNPSRAH